LHLGCEEDKKKSLPSSTTFGENRCFDAQKEVGRYITSNIIVQNNIRYT
jgi:hypothetical protein